MKKSLAFRAVGEVIVSVHTTENPSDIEWQEYLRLCKQTVASGAKACCLVITAGGSPNPKQRAMTREVFGNATTPTAVVSDAATMRFVITAFSLFNPGIRAFPYERGDGLTDALAYLGLEGFTASRIRSAVTDLQGVVSK